MCLVLKTKCYIFPARSPIYSHLSASLNGLTTIRSFGAQPILIREFDKIQDNHSASFYLFISTSRAFGFWLDLFCVMYIAVVTVSFFVYGGEGGNVGLAITQALAMTGTHLFELKLFVVCLRLFFNSFNYLINFNICRYGSMGHATGGQLKIEKKKEN